MFFDIFSSFDYTSHVNFFMQSTSHVLFFLGLIWMIFFFNFFFLKKKFVSSVFFVLMFHKEKTKNSLFKKVKSFYFILSFVFIYMVLSNLWGLFPYIFVDTSQILFVVKLSFFCWLSMVFSSFLKDPLKFFYLFFPSSPGFILPFLNMIELVSFSMRPVTLSLRLSMNMTTGHILMGLMSNMCLFLFSNLSVFTFFLLVVFNAGFCFFELCIGVIQGLVFSLLLKSYFEEHTH